MKIMVIDNEPSMLVLMAKWIRLSGNEPIVELDPEKAPSEVCKYCPDIVFCDISLGGGFDGRLMPALIRGACPVMANVPIIAFTGSIPREEDQELIDAGFTKVWHKRVYDKPYDEFLACLESVMKAKE